MQPRAHEVAFHGCLAQRAERLQQSGDPHAGDVGGVLRRVERDLDVIVGSIDARLDGPRVVAFDDHDLAIRDPVRP